jgi:hypothetical protein
MEEFGVLSWFVVDKEEEIFECDDVRDEDKVIQALWARWIVLHRLVPSSFYELTISDHGLAWQQSLCGKLRSGHQGLYRRVLARDTPRGWLGSFESLAVGELGITDNLVNDKLIPFA